MEHLRVALHHTRPLKTLQWINQCTLPTHATLSCLQHPQCICSNNPASTISAVQQRTHTTHAKKHAHSLASSLLSINAAAEFSFASSGPGWLALLLCLLMHQHKYVTTSCCKQLAPAELVDATSMIQPARLRAIAVYHVHTDMQCLTLGKSCCCCC